MTSKILIRIFLIILFSSVSLFAQHSAQSARAGANGFTLKATFAPAASEIHLNGKVRVMNFPDAVDESRPGTPVLPSKTVFIALPPNQKISVDLSNVQRQVYTNVEPATNPKTVMNRDSSLSYQQLPSSNVFLNSTRYPATDAEVIGYTWLGGYYCAEVKINTDSYQPGSKQITEIQEADIHVAYQNSSAPFRKNSTPPSQYEKELSKIILNYDAAKEFRSFQSAIFSSDTTGNWIHYGQDYVKLKIPSDGIYRITYNDLISYGVPTSINPSTLQIFQGGKELPIYLSAQGASFDTSDYIEFWGTKNYGSKNYRTIVQQGQDYLNYMDRYSDTNIVWLTWGNSNGVRADSLDGSGSSSDTVQSHIVHLHLEQDKQLWYYDAVDPRSQLPFWQEHKVWTWLSLNAGSFSSISFTASSIVPGTQSTTILRLISLGASITTGAHKAGIGINSTTIIDSITFDYRQTVNFQTTFASSKLKQGSNTIRLQSYPTASTVVNQFLVDWADIDYYQYTTAVNDSILITIPDSVAPAFRVIKVTGLTSSNLAVYKLSPNVSKVVNYSVVGSTSKTLLFSDTVSGGDRYYVTSVAKVKKPIFGVKKQFVNLRDASRGADYLIVSNKVLQSSVEAYSSFISSTYQVRTQVAYVDDIFDEFSFGFPHAEAIRYFLQSAYADWQPPAPSYLLLIGDANYDYKNVITAVPAVKKQNLVPSYGDPVSDVWYVAWDSAQADIPQMYVGRIPAANDGDVSFYMQKHQQYLQKPFDDWNKTFLFFSGGDPASSGQIDQIRSTNNTIFTTLAQPPPVGGTGHHFYKTTDPISNFGPYSAQEVQDAIGNGGLFISYIGHSGTQTWDNGITNVSDLKNSYSNRFPLVSDFGCSTGKFAEPDINCFGELFVSESHDGQAIAYLGNSSFGYLSTALTFPIYFYGEILHDTVTDIGKAHFLAKVQQLQGASSSDPRRVFDYCNLLFGDPILNIALPPKPNFVVNNESLSLLGNIPTEADDSVSLQIVVRNLGISPSDSVQVSVNDQFNGATTFRTSYKISPYTFCDTTVIRLPVKNEVGEHTVSVVVDSANVIDEIYENDNSATFKFSVYSLTLRSLDQNNYYNPAKTDITLINPVYKIANAPERIRFSLDTTASFLNPVEITKDFDTISTRVTLPSLIDGKRYWWRAKIDQASLQWSSPNSFINVRSNAQWFATNPGNQTDILYENMAYDQQGENWKIVSAINTLKVISAGGSAGSFASMTYNGSETLPTTYVWGIATALIDTVTLKPYGFQYFLTLNGTTQERTKAADSLTNYINSLSTGTVLAMSICDDGAQSVLGFSAPTTVRNAIKQLGSSFIDSVKYTESWCIIGKKGAAIGSVPEMYKPLFAGAASVEISKTLPSDSGTVLFPEIGVATSWDSVSFNSTMPTASAITIVPLGERSNGQVDTLAPLSVSNGGASLRSLNAVTYPKIKLRIKLYANANKESPTISNIGVYYKKPIQLATNYQVVGTYKAERVPGTDSVAISQTKTDTVVQGKYLGIDWRAYNIGSSTAKNVQVKSSVVWDNNVREELGTVMFDSIPPGSYKEMKIPYNSSAGTGGRQFQINIDPNDSIQEIYRDNNSYSMSFVVVADTVSPPLPNLAIGSNDITVPSTLIPDNLDTIPVTIVVRNTGSARYDSVDVHVEHTYQSAVVETWEKRIQEPILSDTIVVYPVVKGKAGEHQITVVIDPQSKIIESSKDDNSASKTFFVATTDFAIIQPLSMNVSYVSKLILLNPTAEVWDGVKRILLDVDTLDSFSSATRLRETMGQFSTSFDISSLHKAKRYWWRAKVENSTRDWTVGTFYLGDSTSQAVGQIDSAGWSEDTFLYTAYSATAGAHIQDTSEKFRLVSAGYADGNYGDIELNGVNLIPSNIDTCHYVVVFDTNYVLVAKRRFNLYADPAQADSLANFLNSVSTGYYVVAVIIGEGSNNFSTSARNAYKTIGSKYVTQIGYRDSWAIIGRKGAPIGSVPEVYVPTTTGKAAIDTTYFRKEVSGTIITKQFGPVTSWGNLSVQNAIPAGTILGVSVIGISKNGSLDTLAASSNSSMTNLHNVSARQYPSGKIVFSLQLNNANSSPTIKQWMLQSGQPPELAISPTDIFVDKTTLQEGEVANLSMKIFNVSGVDADSVPAEILTDDGGFLRALTSVVVPVIHPQDSVLVQAQYDSRGKRGSHLFYFRVDPDSTIPEIDKSNNSFAVAYTVIGDTIKPTVDVTFDGAHVFDEEYVSKTPTIVFQMSDNNLAPLTSADTSSFYISLNGNKISFAPPEQIEFIPVKSQVVWKPNLPEGENALNYFVKDIAGNSSDTAWLFVNVTSAFNLRDVYNIPNPFSNGTHFTFVLTGATPPSDMKIKIYTIAGRAIQEIQVPPSDLRIGFNKVYWDGRDHDGDEIANGVYLYRIVTTTEGQQATSTGKMVKIR
jgi:subtilase family serine protease